MSNNQVGGRAYWLVLQMGDIITVATFEMD